MQLHTPRRLIDHHAVVVVTRRIGRLGQHILHARVVVGGIQTSKLRDRLLHHGFHFRIIGNVAADAQGLMSLVGKLLGFRLNFALVPIRQHHGRSRLRERLRCCQAQSGRCARHECYLSFE